MNISIFRHLKVVLQNDESARTSCSMKLIFCLTSIEVEVNSGISSSSGQGCLGLLKVFKVKPHTLAV